MLAYDAVPNYIALAVREAQARGIANVRFVVHNSRAQYNDGRPRMPAEDGSVDLWVSSKGPGHAVKDAPRVRRDADAGPRRRRALREAAPPVEPSAARTLRSRGEITAREDPNWAYRWIAGDLADVGVKIHSWWDIDVPVYYPTPRDLYNSLAWPFPEDEAPAYEEVAQDFERIFAAFGGPQGVEGRWRRSIWKAVKD